MGKMRVWRRGYTRIVTGRAAPDKRRQILPKLPQSARLTHRCLLAPRHSLPGATLRQQTPDLPRQLPTTRHLGTSTWMRTPVAAGSVCSCLPQRRQPLCSVASAQYRHSRSQPENLGAKITQNGQLLAIWIRPATEWAIADRTSHPDRRAAGAGLLSSASSILTDLDEI